MALSIFKSGGGTLPTEKVEYAIQYLGGTASNFTDLSSEDFATFPANNTISIKKGGRYFVEGSAASGYGGSYPGSLVITTGGKEITIPSSGQFTSAFWTGKLSLGDTVKYVVSGNNSVLSVYRIGG